MTPRAHGADGPPLPDPKRMDRLYAKAGLLITQEVEASAEARVRGRITTAADFLGGTFLGMTAAENAAWDRQHEVTP